MKKLLLIFILIAGCKKDDWTTPIAVGTKFNYDTGKNSLKSLTRNNETPINPFTVDSVAKGAYQGYNGYWCSSANGMSYVIDPVVIRGHIL